MERIPHLEALKGLNAARARMPVYDQENAIEEQWNDENQNAKDIKASDQRH